MSIRRAVETDAEQIAELMDQLGYQVSISIVLEKLRRLLLHPDHVTLVYSESDKIGGFISMHVIPEIGIASDTAQICYLVVSAAMRRRGIGEALESACMSIAKERGCDRVQLHCAEHRLEAHRFYESLGYRESPKLFRRSI